MVPLVIPVLGRLKQEDQEFKTSLAYVRPSLKQRNRQPNKPCSLVGRGSVQMENLSCGVTLRPLGGKTCWAEGKKVIQDLVFGE